MIKYAILCSIILINLTGCYENKINNKLNNMNQIDFLSLKIKELELISKELKEENDLSDKGIFKEPKPFKSIADENKAIETLTDVQIPKGVSHQQYSVSSANKLADFLSDLLNNMQNTSSMIVVEKNLEIVLTSVKRYYIITSASRLRVSRKRGVAQLG